MGEFKVFKRALKLFQKYMILPPYGEKHNKIFTLRFCFIIAVWSTPALIGNFLYLWRILTKDEVSLVSLLQSLQMNGEVLAAGATGFTTVYYITEISEFLHRLGIHKFSEPERLAETYEKHDKIAKYFYFSTRIIAVVRIIFNLLENSFCEAKQKFHDERYLCGLLLPCWLPFKMNIFFKSWVMAGSDLLLAVYLPIGALGYFVIFGISELIVLRMQKMIRMLKELDFEGNEQIIETQLLECIEYHSELWDLVKMMNNSLGNCHVSQYSLVALVIALLEYELAVSYDVTAFFQLTVWITGELMVCSAGQNMENEREAMALALYLTPWYKLPVKSRKTFTMFLAQMQVPLYFEARPMIHLNYELLMKVLKGSYTFLMFLKNTSM